MICGVLVRFERVVHEVLSRRNRKNTPLDSITQANPRDETLVKYRLRLKRMKRMPNLYFTGVAMILLL